MSGIGGGRRRNGGGLSRQGLSCAFCLLSFCLEPPLLLVGGNPVFDFLFGHDIFLLLLLLLGR